jgi:hypothetical protein
MPIVHTCGELRRLLSDTEKYPDDLLVMVQTDDGNGYCHEPLSLKIRRSYVQSTSSMRGWSYEEIKVRCLEVS